MRTAEEAHDALAEAMAVALEHRDLECKSKVRLCVVGDPEPCYACRGRFALDAYRASQK